MIHRLIDLSAKNKFLVLAIVIVGCLWGGWAMRQMPLDVLPDLGETQVVIVSRWERSPDVIEDQVTHPIVAALTGAPKVRTVRGISDYGYSYVYAIFDEGTDIYWARSRTLEYLSSVREALPKDVRTELGPDATGLGWVFQYVLQDDSGKHNLAELRSYQDWRLKYYLKALPGVAEVASIGGFVPEYQINIDPNRLRSYNIPISRVAEVVRDSNSETGARVLDVGGAEYMIRGRGYIQSVRDLEETVLASENGSPIRIKDVGSVVVGPAMRRGIADLNGEGDVVSGIIVMREGSNALDVIDRVKRRLEELKPGLPEGVRIVPVYDRSELIDRSISSARWTVVEVMIAVAVTIIIFLWHFPSAAIPVVTIPVAVLLTFVPLQLLGVSINVMTLAGIAIACGALVDAAIIVGEQTHRKLEQAQGSAAAISQENIVLAAVKEVAGATFFALLVMAIAFLPILALEGTEGQLFRPLVLAKTFAVLAAAALSLTLDPVLRLLLIKRPRSPRDKSGWLPRLWNSLTGAQVRPEEQHFILGPLTRLYEPVVRWTLRNKLAVIAIAGGIAIVTLPILSKLDKEYMPPLDEGALMYMPSTMPGISIAQAEQVLRATGQVLKTFPEVEQVLGKAGRADTATDPAPLSMLETLIILKPRSEWRGRHVWYSSWAPSWMLPALRRVTSDRISQDQLMAEMDATLKLPGVSNAWTMPIRGRIEMLSTGMRTPVGLKVQGADLADIQETGRRVELLLRGVSGTRSVFAERTNEGSYLDVAWDRRALGRYDISMEEAQEALATAVGGETITTTISGRERRAVSVRYFRDFRSDLDAIGRVLIPAGDSGQVQLSQLASLNLTTGPAMIRNENGLLTGYVFVDLAPGVSPIRYVDRAREELRQKLRLNPGSSVAWSGEYESVERVRNRLMLIIPGTFAAVLLLLYINTRSMAKTMIILLAAPFSAIGAIWMLYLLGYHVSPAVWVGIVALLGIDAGTGVFMLLYLDLAYAKAKGGRQTLTRDELHEAIVEGAAKRLRPKLMTFATMSVGLIPVLWSVGAGSGIMKRIAAPMVGGILTSFAAELLLYPAIYAIWRQRTLSRPAEVASA